MLLKKTSRGANDLEVTCACCGKRIWSQLTYADLEGKSFINWYCKECVEEIKKEDQWVRVEE